VLIGIALVVILILFACGVFSKGPGGATKEILSQLTEINLGSDDAYPSLIDSLECCP